MPTRCDVTAIGGHTNRAHPTLLGNEEKYWSVGILPVLQAGASLERHLKSKPYSSMNPLETQAGCLRSLIEIGVLQFRNVVSMLIQSEV